MAEKKTSFVVVKEFGIKVVVREGYSTYTPFTAELLVEYPGISFRIELPLRQIIEAVETIKFAASAEKEA